jgi:hypothetical protein
MPGVDEPAHRNRAQIDDGQVVAHLEHLDSGGLEPDREARCAVDETEEGGLARAVWRAPAPDEQRIEPRVDFPQHTSSPLIA